MLNLRQGSLLTIRSAQSWKDKAREALGLWGTPLRCTCFISASNHLWPFPERSLLPSKI